MEIVISLLMFLALLLSKRNKEARSKNGNLLKKKKRSRNTSDKYQCTKVKATVIVHRWLIKK